MGLAVESGGFCGRGARCGCGVFLRPPFSQPPTPPDLRPPTTTATTLGAATLAGLVFPRRGEKSRRRGDQPSWYLLAFPLRTKLVDYNDYDYQTSLRTEAISGVPMLTPLLKKLRVLKWIFDHRLILIGLSDSKVLFSTSYHSHVHGHLFFTLLVQIFSSHCTQDFIHLRALRLFNLSLYSTGSIDFDNFLHSFQNPGVNDSHLISSNRNHL